MAGAEGRAVTAALDDEEGAPPPLAVFVVLRGAPASASASPLLVRFSLRRTSPLRPESSTSLLAFVNSPNPPFAPAL